MDDVHLSGCGNPGRSASPGDAGIPTGSGQLPCARKLENRHGPRPASSSKTNAAGCNAAGRGPVKCAGMTDDVLLPAAGGTGRRTGHVIRSRTFWTTGIADHCCRNKLSRRNPRSDVVGVPARRGGGSRLTRKESPRGVICPDSLQTAAEPSGPMDLRRSDVISPPCCRGGRSKEASDCRSPRVHRRMLGARLTAIPDPAMSSWRCDAYATT